MAQIEGITTTTNEQGEITHVTIEVQKHKDAVAPILRQLGIEEKTAFQKEWEKAINVEDARKRSLKHIDDLWEKSK